VLGCGRLQSYRSLLNPGISSVMITGRPFQAAMQTLPNYELLEVLTEEEPCTFRARQVSSGRTVLLHRLSGGPSYPDQVGLIRTVVRYLRRASTTSRRLVLDMVEYDGAMYLVTEVLPGFLTLKQWLASELKGQEESPAGSLQVTASSSFPVSEGGAGESPMQPPETKQHSSSEEPGEFTRMFQGPGAASPPLYPGDVTQPGSEKVPSPESEKSTEIVPPSGSDRSKPVGTEVPTAASGEVAASPDEGEFTRIFHYSTVDRSSRVPIEVPEASLDKGTASPEPGEFTRLFQAPVVDKPGPPPAEVPDSISGVGRSEFTAIFKSPTDAERPSAPDIQPSAPKEVGDFTRIFGSPGFSAPSSERLPTSRPAEPATPAQVADNETASGPQRSTVAVPPQPVAQPGPEIPSITPPEVGKKPPLPAPKAPSISPPKVPDKPSLPARPAQPPIQHAPPVIAPTPAPKVPQPKLPQPELPTSDEPPSFLPWILILGGLVLLGLLLIVYVFVRG
jgi:hypothetical protein